MADLLSGGVMRGLVGASSAMKAANTSMSVYTQAKAKNDESAMQRSLGYATDSMTDATEATEESKKALAENVQAAREQEQAEQAARLEEIRQESAAEAKAEMQANSNVANTKMANPVDTIEISPEAVAALQGEQPVAPEQSEDMSDVSIKQPVQHTETQVTTHTQTTHVKADSGEVIKMNNGKLNIKV